MYNRCVFSTHGRLGSSLLLFAALVVGCASQALALPASEPGSGRADGNPPAPDLPPVELVRDLRQAAIWHAKGEHESERQVLLAAQEAFASELILLPHLLEYYQTHEQDGTQAPEMQAQKMQAQEMQVQEMEERIVGRLEQSGTSWTFEELQPLATAAAGNERILRAIAEHLSSFDERETLDQDRAELLVQIGARLEDLSLEIRGLERLVAIGGVPPSVDDEDVTRELPVGMIPRFAFGRDWSLIDRQRLTQAYREAGRFDDALSLLRRRATIESPLLLFRSYLIALVEAGEYREAQELIERAKKVEATGDGIEYPLHPQLLVDLAWKAHDAGREEMAEALFRHALSLSPESAEVKRTVTYLYGSVEDVAAFEREEARRRSAEVDPRALFDEGTRLLTSGDAQTAAEMLRRAVESLPAMEAAWYNLGMASYRIEDWLTAAEALQRAATLKADRIDTHFFLGMALQRLERCDEAVIALERTLELDPEKLMAHYFLADCYDDLGQSEKSREHIERYRASQQ